VTRGSLERPLIIVCNAIRQQLMNNAVMHVISADTTLADTIHPVSVPIRYRSDNRPFSIFYRRHSGPAVQYGNDSAETTVVEEGESQVVGL